MYLLSALNSLSYGTCWVVLFDLGFPGRSMSKALHDTANLSFVHSYTFSNLSPAFGPLLFDVLSGKLYDRYADPVLISSPNEALATVSPLLLFIRCMQLLDQGTNWVDIGISMNGGGGLLSEPKDVRIMIRLRASGCTRRRILAVSYGVDQYGTHDFSFEPVTGLASAVLPVRPGDTHVPRQPVLRNVLRRDRACAGGVRRRRHEADLGPVQGEGRCERASRLRQLP